MGLLFLLAALVLAPVILMLVGLIMAFSADRENSKKGGKFLLFGFLALLVVVLIGFAVCSNMNFVGMH